MRARRGDTAFTLLEILLTVVIVALLLAFLVPLVQHNRKQVHTPRSSIAAELARVESAKEMYAADRQVKVGTPVTLQALIVEGYYRASPSEALHDITFIPGKVGQPADYTTGSSEHDTHHE